MTYVDKRSAAYCRWTETRIAELPQGMEAGNFWNQYRVGKWAPWAHAVKPNRGQVLLKHADGSVVWLDIMRQCTTVIDRESYLIPIPGAPVVTRQIRGEVKDVMVSGPKMTNVARVVTLPSKRVLPELIRMKRGKIYRTDTGEMVFISPPGVKWYVLKEDYYEAVIVREAWGALHG